MELRGALSDRRTAGLRALYLWRRQDGPHPHRHLLRPDELRSLRHGRLGTTDAHWKDRHPGLALHEGRPVEQVLHLGALLAGAFREYDQRLTGLDDLDAPPQGLTVGAAPGNRETAQRSEQLAPSSLPEGVLGHVPEPALREHQYQQEVEVGAVHGRDDVGTLLRDVSLAVDRDPEPELGESE